MGDRVSETVQAEKLFADILQDLLERHIAVEPAAHDEGCDARFELDGEVHCVQFKRTGNIASVVSATHRGGNNTIVVVPFMSDAAAKYCLAEDVSWVDLSGNARIKTEQFLLKSRGRPNRFRRKDPTPNPFAPKSSRLVRQLLSEPDRTYTQKDLVELTKLPQGLVSRLVRSLKESGFLRNSRSVNLIRPNALLDAWVESDRFERHEILRGHISSQNGEQLLQSLAEKLDELEIRYSATGLSGAWARDHFARFRLVTLYVERFPTKSELKGLDFRQMERGPNVWFVRPRDLSMLEDSEQLSGLECQRPVQLYVDLQAQPERAMDAAEELRKRHLRWGEDGTEA